MERNEYRVETESSKLPKSSSYENESSSSTRKRNINYQRMSAQAELERLRKLVEEVENERQESQYYGCGKGTVEPSFMSTVFGVVLVSIIAVSIYAFLTLYRALVKRFSET